MVLEQSNRRVLALAGVLAASLMLVACGRSGAPLRPEPGVIIMDEEAKEAGPNVEDRPFVLDGLL